MAFISLPSTWIEVGRALKKKIFNNLKNSLDDHETRINGLEEGANKIELFNFEVMGYINHYSAAELVQIGTFKAPIDLTIIEASLTLMNSSNGPTSNSDGYLEIDLQKSTDNGVTWNTILETKPRIEVGVTDTGSVSGIVTFITNGENINADEIVRVNVTSKKDTQGSFLITVYGEIA